MSDVQSTVEYREIQGIHGCRVGNDGSVWSRRVRGASGTAAGVLGEWKILSQYRRPYGSRYVVVCLRPNPRDKVICRYVHRLVLESFVGPCPDGMVACHNDRDTSNNNVKNLRWDTQAGNLQDRRKHGTHGWRLAEQDVIAIRDLYLAGKRTRFLATQFDVSKTTIQRVVSGQTWRHIPLPTSLLPKGKP